MGRIKEGALFAFTVGGFVQGRIKTVATINQLETHLDLGHLCLRQLLLLYLRLLLGPLSVVGRVNLCKDWQSLCGGLVRVNEFALVVTRAKQGLKDEHLGRVVVPVQLLEVAMLVSEHAPRPIHASLRVVERAAVVRLELLVVADDSRLG